MFGAVGGFLVIVTIVLKCLVSIELARPTEPQTRQKSNHEPLCKTSRWTARQRGRSAASGAASPCPAWGKFALGRRSALRSVGGPEQCAQRLGRRQSKPLRVKLEDAPVPPPR